MSHFNFTKRNFLVKDTLYNNFLVNLFINKILKNGNRSLATSLIYNALKLLKFKTKNVLKLVEIAVFNSRPKIRLKELSFKKGARTAVIKFEFFKSIRIAIKWLILNAIKRSKKPFYVNLANELNDASKKRGLTIYRRKEFHKIVNLKKTAL